MGGTVPRMRRNEVVTQSAIPIEIPIEVKQIDVSAAAAECPLCFATLEPALVTWQLPPQNPIVTGSEPVPGYRCPSCTAEYLAEESAKAVFDATQTGLRRLDKDVVPPGDRGRIQAFRRAVRAINRLR